MTLIAVVSIRYLPRKGSREADPNQKTEKPTKTKKQIKKTNIKSNERILRSYVVIFLILTAADWMQGPYLYALYSSYGHSAKSIG